MKSLSLTVTMTICLAASVAQAGSTLEAVMNKGHVQCGVSQSLPGFSHPDNRGRWSGIDADLCRAIAAAVFANADNVKFTPLSPKERFTALQSGEVDLLSRNTTWTVTRDTALGLNFAGVNFYDGQGFMVRKNLGVNKASELDGATVCTTTGTTNELNLADYFRANNMTFDAVAFEKGDEVVAAYDAGRCDAYTADRTGLYAQRVKLKDQDEHKLLPEVISKEPLGPVVRHGDDQWLDIVKWTHNCMVNAEELGVDSSNIDDMARSSNPAVKRLVGVEGDSGRNLGLDAAWCRNAIKLVGNYGEVFDRNLGPTTALKIERGLNALWSDGGLMYAPPIR